MGPPVASDEPVSAAVVTAVADAKGVDPLDLDPLYESIDPDGLDSIFSQADEASAMELRFRMAGCEVVVRGADEISVTPPTRHSDAGAAVSSED